jgi:hypothetical protein
MFRISCLALLVTRALCALTPAAGESRHPVFGKVNSGMDVVLKISKVLLHASFKCHFLIFCHTACSQHTPRVSGQDRQRLPRSAHHDAVHRHLGDLSPLASVLPPPTETPPIFRARCNGGHIRLSLDLAVFCARKSTTSRFPKLFPHSPQIYAPQAPAICFVAR